MRGLSEQQCFARFRFHKNSNMIAIIDYGMGNLRSVQKALEKTGSDARITHDAQIIKDADKVVLPGVGAVRPAMERLEELNLIPAIQTAVESGKPFLGICLGYQLLFETSTEGGQTPGLGLLQGTVQRFTGLKVPHMGWNRIKFPNLDCPIWKGLDDGSHVYFCHSYYVSPKDKGVIAAWTEYGIDFAAAVWEKNIFGTQFHPEKSQEVGLQILQNFGLLSS